MGLFDILTEQTTKDVAGEEKPQAWKWNTPILAATDVEADGRTAK